MNIVVCLKYIRGDLVYPNDKDVDKFVINPYDLYAFERAVEWKEKCTGLTITCLIMGPKGLVDYLKKLYAMGADQVICLSDPVFAGSDTVATTYILSNFIKEYIKYDVIICGEIAVDGETGQVPAGLAERLNTRYISGVRIITDLNEKTVTVETNSNDFDTNLLIRLPAVLTMNEFTTKTKNISLIALKRARQKEIAVYSSKDFNVDLSRCGLKGSKTKVLEVEANFIKKDGLKFLDDCNGGARLIRELVMEN